MSSNLKKKLHSLLTLVKAINDEQRPPRMLTSHDQDEEFNRLTADMMAAHQKYSQTRHFDDHQALRQAVNKLQERRKALDEEMSRAKAVSEQPPAPKMAQAVEPQATPTAPPTQASTRILTSHDQDSQYNALNAELSRAAEKYQASNHPDDHAALMEAASKLKNRRDELDKEMARSPVGSLISQKTVNKLKGIQEPKKKAASREPKVGRALTAEDAHTVLQMPLDERNFPMQAFLHAHSLIDQMGLSQAQSRAIRAKLNKIRTPVDISKFIVNHLDAKEQAKIRALAREQE